MGHASAQASWAIVSIPDAYALSSGKGWEVAHPFHGVPSRKCLDYRAARVPAVQKGEEGKQKLRSTVFPSPVHTFDISEQE